MIIDDLSDFEESMEDDSPLRAKKAKYPRVDQNSDVFPPAFDDSPPAKRAKREQTVPQPSQEASWPPAWDDIKQASTHTTSLAYRELNAHLDWRAHSQYPLTAPSGYPDKVEEGSSVHSVEPQHDPISLSDGDDPFDDPFHRLVYQCVRQDQRQISGYYADLISSLVKNVHHQAIVATSWPIEIDDLAFQRKLIELLSRVKRTLNLLNPHEISLPSTLEVLSLGVEDTARSLMENYSNDNKDEEELIEDLRDYFQKIDLKSLRTFLDTQTDFSSIEGDALALSVLLKPGSRLVVRSLKNCFMLAEVGPLEGTHTQQSLIHQELGLSLEGVCVDPFFLLHNPTLQQIFSVAQDQRIQELFITFDAISEKLLRPTLKGGEGEKPMGYFDHLRALRIQLPDMSEVQGGQGQPLGADGVIKVFSDFIANMRNLKYAEVYLGKYLAFSHRKER